MCPMPAIDDLRTMNDYMVKRMRIGTPVDMEAFVDTRFADAACKDRVSSNLLSYLHIADHAGQASCIGVAVDSVSEVLTIRSTHIDPTPRFGARIRHVPLSKA